MKKVLSVALALVMALGLLAVPAFATIDASGEADAVPVILNTEAPTFSVTLPTAFTIDVDEDGAVTCATNLKIVNNSNGAVQVTGMAIAGANSWATAAYTTNFGQYPVNTKVFGMEILDQQTTGANAIAYDHSKFVNDIDDNFMWSGIGQGIVTPEHNEIALPYAAKVAGQAVEVEDATIANVTFTVAWQAAA